MSRRALVSAICKTEPSARPATRLSRAPLTIAFARLLSVSGRSRWRRRDHRARRGPRRDDRRRRPRPAVPLLHGGVLRSRSSGATRTSGTGPPGRSAACPWSGTTDAVLREPSRGPHPAGSRAAAPMARATLWCCQRRLRRGYLTFDDGHPSPSSTVKSLICATRPLARTERTFWLPRPGRIALSAHGGNMPAMDASDRRRFGVLMGLRREYRDLHDAARAVVKAWEAGEYAFRGRGDDPIRKLVSALPHRSRRADQPTVAARAPRHTDN